MNKVDVPESHGLRFDSANDCLNFAREAVDRSNRWLASKGTRTANGKGEVTLRIRGHGGLLWWEKVL